MSTSPSPSTQQEANTSFKIRGVVEGLLPDTLRRIPIEKRFNRAYVREICREADGYQPHLVSPERGIRRLVAEAMLLTNDHVHRFVDEVHGVLQDTVREAARRSVLAEAGLGATPGMEFLRLKGFENAVVVAADRALEEWKAEAHKVASTMVAMECDYVTPSFFRELEREWQEAQHGGAGGDGEEGAGGGAGPGAPAIRDAGDDDDDDSEDGVADGEAGRGSATPGSAPPPVSTAPDLKGGWLDKRSGDSSSLNALPVDSWKWQRRWFVLAGAAGVLAYFRNPEEAAGRTAQPRVTIPLKACMVGSVEDLDAYYDRLGAFTGTYARAIYDRMSKTVPKAIILCQVIRSRDRLLDQLYTYLTALKPIEIEALLQEDSTVVKRRSAAQTAAKELELAQDEVRRAQERRATGTSPRVEKAAVSARALLLAGAFPLVPANLVPRGTNPAKLYGEHTPMALSPGPNEGPNSIRLGPPVKVQADGSAANGRGEEAQEAPRASPAPAMEPEAEPAPSSKPPRRQPPPPPPKLAS
ncbi:Dynamin-2B [Auxenochlorella protothecoides]|uniref:Dynamin-2B n=1 Tax=Auxenochlorella protothecoides TaxID=3075 RepID=A0A087SHT0_AUXPR|nr:Dynamin-2B [Auxenochlorella protothecoides]KFM25284.1 Dynamin-2B [Auxenochlorella protothecoides]